MEMIFKKNFIFVVIATLFLFSSLFLISISYGNTQGNSTTIEYLTQGRLTHFPVYRPDGTPKNFIILLSDQKGWDNKSDQLARLIASQGIMVIGVDTPAFLADFEKDEEPCVYPEGDLENAGRFVQAYYKLPTYYPPLLVGYGSGAALTFAALVQAPPDTFAGGLSMHFSPYLPLHKPLCKSYGIAYHADSEKPGVDLLPTQKLHVPWIVLHRENDASLPAVKNFVAQTPGAKLVTLPEKAPFPPSPWSAPYKGALDFLLAKSAEKILPPPPADLGDLPLIDVPVATGVLEQPAFAVLISGDGGWAKIDRDIAKTLAENGIHVVGFDSLRYFWKAHTPETTAFDINKIILYYLHKTHKNQVLLVGYSQGADVLPFIINRLPKASQDHIALAAVIGLSEHAQFEFHLSSWISDSEEGLSTLPEVERITHVPFACIYGDEEDDSPCPRLAGQNFHVIKLQGGHHFEGNYGLLAHEILKLRHALNAESK